MIASIRFRAILFILGLAFLVGISPDTFAGHGSSSTDSLTYSGILCERIGAEGAFTYDNFSSNWNLLDERRWVLCPLVREDLGHFRPDQVLVFVRDNHSSQNIRCRLMYTLANGEVYYGFDSQTSGQSSPGTTTSLSLGVPSNWDRLSSMGNYSVACELPADASDNSGVFGIRYDEQELEAGADDQKVYPGSYCNVGDNPPRGTGVYADNFFDSAFGGLLNYREARLHDIHCPVVRDIETESDFGIGSWDTPVYVIVEDRHPEKNAQCHRVVRSTDGTYVSGPFESTDGQGIDVLALGWSGSPNTPDNASYSIKCELPAWYDSVYFDGTSKILGYMVSE